MLRQEELLSATAKTQVTTRRQLDRRYVLSILSTGHGVSHWFDQSFPVLLPTITSALGLSTLQVGSIATVKEIGSGLVNVPGG